ncbi:TetR/AcrR family transcriptional regulator [Belliella marina]|uniref:TetR/AcrR family transcriptional regulator n=1 Tax=Belliella marina TaxID=1644146 RepID=A0ABW4VL02_9BACT
MARTKVFDEEVVLEKAMYLFWQKGYNATSAQDLVDNLGISRSSMYDTYGDKHSLFVKALKKYRTDRIDPVLKAVDTTPYIENYVNDFFEFIRKEQFGEPNSIGCFLVNSAVELAPVDPEIAEIANAIMIDTEEALYKAIKKGQQIGIYTKKFSARALAKFVFNALNGLRVTVKFDTNHNTFNDIINVSLSALKV